MSVHGVKFYGFDKAGVLFFALAQVIAAAFIVLFAFSAHAAGVTQVSTGADSTCAVKESKAYCWGSNASGKLGNGGVGVAQTSPVAVKTAGTGGMGDKKVLKVSVGTNHACALADAQVFCWGDNTYGELGDTTNTSSDIPVIVSTKNTPTTTSKEVCTATFLLFGFFPICTASKTVVTNLTASALRDKEIVDISVGEDFSCALSSSGNVSCWGKGANGRLGTNNEVDANIPQAVYKQSGSALVDKKGVKLAKVAGGTMCVFATDNSTNQNLSSAKPYCWGHGVGSGSVPGDKYVKCSITSTTNTNLNTTKTVYFDALQPLDSSGVIGFVGNGDIGNSDIITSVGNDQKAYYWGLHGYTVNEKTVRSGSSAVQTGSVCSQRLKSTTDNGKSSPNHCGGAGKPGCGGPKVTYVTYYYYDETFSYKEIGSATVLGPLYNGAVSANPLNQKSISMSSGNALDGLFCAKTDAGIYCDAHGASPNDGRTGNAAPTASGPQLVTANGWLSGKTVTQMNTSQTGYTCVVADGSVGCWGDNTNGKLGTGDTADKKVPTATVNL